MALNTTEILERLREQGDCVRLHFSCGKDSLATWLVLRDAGFRVVPMYFYLVPDLAFVERSLAMYEDFFGVEIVRMPHPIFEKRLACCDLQDAFGYRQMYSLDWPSGEEFDKLGEHYMREIGEPDRWICIGVRAWDSLSRRMVMQKCGELRPKNRTAFPLAWWKKADVDVCIAKHGAPIADDYKIFGRSFDGLDYRFVHKIKTNWPEDYSRIIDWFPMVDAELLRGEWFRE